MIKKFIPKSKLILFIYILGIVVVAYPIFSNIYSKSIQNGVVKEYEQSVANKDKARNQKKLEEMKKHNEELIDQQATLTGTDFGIDAEENIKNKELGEVLGIIDIPKINVKLPIYYGTNERQISEGAGVMKETSLPVGGPSTHSVITSHRGLPTAKLFTDLPKLAKGDTFFIEAADEILAYEVDQIKVVRPEDFNDLEIIKGKDMVTLLTCTPYLINSHRLLVRGERIVYSEDLKIEASNKGIWEQIKAILLWLGLLLLFMLIIYLLNRYLQKRRRIKAQKNKILMNRKRKKKRPETKSINGEKKKKKRTETELVSKEKKKKKRPETEPINGEKRKKKRPETEPVSQEEKKLPMEKQAGARKKRRVKKMSNSGSRFKTKNTRKANGNTGKGGEK